MKKTTGKIVVVGAGHVGSAVLNATLSLQLAAEIAIIDVIDDKARGEAMDASHGMPFAVTASTYVHAGGFEECSDADVIIIAAGPSILPGEKLDRLLLAERNVKTIDDVMRSIVQYTTDAVIVMITNPLDITAYCAQALYNYPQGKIFGTGTMLETGRLRQILGSKYGVSSKHVYGYMLGEHGNSAFPAWSLVNIGGVPAAQLDDFFPAAEPLDYEAIGAQAVNIAYDVVNAKGFTNFGIAMVAGRLARAVLYDEQAIFPVSTILTGEYGLTDVSISLPCLINRNGVQKRLAVPLAAQEVERLKDSADNLRRVLKNVGVI